MIKVLSTKKLTSFQKEILADSSIRLMDYSAINIRPLKCSIPEPLEYVIFTSQHTVECFVAQIRGSSLQWKTIKAFCVGPKTACLVERKGIKVVHYENYAAELADYIVRYYPKGHFDFFCGNLRRDTIPSALLKHRISYTETQLYETKLVSRQWDEAFDAVLFFSPSGVRSFFEDNVLPSRSFAICIGKTTAAEAQNYARLIEIAAETTVESVLQTARGLIHHYKRIP